MLEGEHLIRNAYKDAAKHTKGMWQDLKTKKLHYDCVEINRHTLVNQDKVETQDVQEKLEAMHSERDCACKCKDAAINELNFRTIKLNESLVEYKNFSKSYHGWSAKKFSARNQ